jgi:hypothetical protein
MTYPAHAGPVPARDPELPPFTGCPTPDVDCAWAPLERLALVAAAAGCPFHPHAFMYMGPIPGRDGATIHAFKHSDTRRYIHVDDAGHTYRYARNRFTAHRSPADAITEAYR